MPSVYMPSSDQLVKDNTFDMECHCTVITLYSKINLKAIIIVQRKEGYLHEGNMKT